MPIFTLAGTSVFTPKSIGAATVGFSVSVPVRIDDQVNPAYSILVNIDDLTLVSSHVDTGLIRLFHVMFAGDATYDQDRIVQLISLVPELFYTVVLQPALDSGKHRNLDYYLSYPSMPAVVNNPAVWG